MMNTMICFWRFEIINFLIVLELGGNLIDVCGIGIYTALKNTMLPKLEIERGDNNEVEIQLTDDPLDGVEIDFLSPILTCTIGKELFMNGPWKYYI